MNTCEWITQNKLFKKLSALCNNHFLLGGTLDNLKQTLGRLFPCGGIIGTSPNRVIIGKIP
jgi:hypothetical protein